MKEAALADNFEYEPEQEELTLHVEIAAFNPPLILSSLLTHLSAHLFHTSPWNTFCAHRMANTTICVSFIVGMVKRLFI
jgi:hypothetical protein